MPIIGREHPADIIIPAPQVSACHAQIHSLGGGFYKLTDMGSSNGTYVNDRRIQSAQIRLSDRVSLGSFIVDLSAYQAVIDGVAGPPVATPPAPMPAAPPVPAAIPPPGPPEPVARPTPRPPEPRLHAPLVPAEPEPTAVTPIVQKGGWRPCPSCGSEEVVSLKVFEQKNPKEMKVKTGCLGGLAGTFLFFKLLPIFLVLGLGGAVLFFTVGALAPEVIVGVGAGIVLLLVISVLVRASGPKYICERCGGRFK